MTTFQSNFLIRIYPICCNMYLGIWIAFATFSHSFNLKLPEQSSFSSLNGLLIGVNWMLVAASDYACRPSRSCHLQATMYVYTSLGGRICTSVVSCLPCGRIRLAFIVLRRSRKWTFHDRLFTTRLCYDGCHANTRLWWTRPTLID